MIALLEDIGYGELLLIAVAGVLLFGKRLPEVASQAGAQLTKLRRSLQDIKHETGMDHEVRKIQRTIEEAIPRDLSVGEIARLASNKMQERIEATRKEIVAEAEGPAAAPASAPEAGAPAGPPAPAPAPSPEAPIGPPSSDSALARRPGGSPVPRGAPQEEERPPAA